MTADAAQRREQLQHVSWIGGGSGAGKSTIARRVAAAHGLRVYATDDAMAEHASRSTPERCPLLHEFLAMDMDEKWLNRSPHTMLDTFHWFSGEGFGATGCSPIAFVIKRSVSNYLPSRSTRR